MDKFIFTQKTYNEAINSGYESIKLDALELLKGGKIENYNIITKRYYTKDKNGNKVFSAVETDGLSDRINGDIVKLIDGDFGELRQGWLQIGCNICNNGDDCGYECGSWGDYNDNGFFVYRTHMPGHNCRIKSSEEIELIKRMNTQNFKTK